MERAIVSFHQDGDEDWVARLECGHRQHVRHRPPFRLRPWIEDAGGRASRIGTPLECPLCDRAEVPDGLEPLGTTETWNENTLPAALLREHRVPSGRWEVLRVHSGAVRFVGAGDPAAGRLLEAGATQALPPGAPHRLEPVGPVVVTVELLRIPPEADGDGPAGGAPVEEGGDPACWANLVCPECGAVVGPDPHREGCSAARPG